MAKIMRLAALAAAMVAAVLLAFGGDVWAVDTGKASQVTTVTEVEGHTVRHVEWEWDTGASQTTISSVTVARWAGEILYYAASPNTGTSSPTTAYDVKILNENGWDVLVGRGTDMPNSKIASRSTSSSKFATGFLPLESTVLTLSITGAGTTSKGWVTLYIR